MDTPEGELPHSDPWMDTPYRYIKHLLNWKNICRWHFIQFGKGGTWWPSSMRFSLTLKYIYIIFPFLIVYQRGKRLCIFCPFFICGGNIEVTFCSLLMDPRRQTSNPVMDVAFSFFLSFGTECDDDENGTHLFEHLPTRWLLCERHPTFQFDLMMVCMEIKC